MTEKDIAAKAKQHDLEETPRERARRLVRQDVLGKNGDAGLARRLRVLRERLHHHGRFLSETDQRELIDWLERQVELSRTILEGVGDDPEFGFSSDILDDDGDLR